MFVELTRLVPLTVEPRTSVAIRWDTVEVDDAGAYQPYEPSRVAARGLNGKLAQEVYAAVELPEDFLGVAELEVCAKRDARVDPRYAAFDYQQSWAYSLVKYSPVPGGGRREVWHAGAPAARLLGRGRAIVACGRGMRGWSSVQVRLVLVPDDGQAVTLTGSRRFHVHTALE